MTSASLESTTTMRPPWLGIGRVLWLAYILATLFVYVTATRTQLQTELPSCAAPTADCPYWTISQEDMAVAEAAGLNPNVVYGIIFGSIAFIKFLFLVLAFLLLARRSDDWMALLISVMFTSFILEGTVPFSYTASLGYILFLIGGGIFFILPFIFPNGRFVPEWIGWPIIFFNAIVSFLPSISFNLTMIALIPWIIATIYAVTYRYRHVANPIERQQFKWVMGGILGWAACFCILATVGYFYPPNEPSIGRLNFMLFLNGPLYAFSLLILPLTVAIAILRYRLWDIDLIIRKTLIYTLLTSLLVAVYFGSVVLLQSLFEMVSGQRSAVSIILSTLLIAALFTPLQRRIRQAIDRRFYRTKYDARQTLATFAATARDEVDLEKLSAALLHTIDQTMQPQHISLWLKPPARK